MWIVDVSKRSDSTLSANALISMPLHCNTFAVCNASPVWSGLQWRHPDLGLVSATSKPSSWPVTILSDVSSFPHISTPLFLTSIPSVRPSIWLVTILSSQISSVPQSSSFPDLIILSAVSKPSSRPFFLHLFNSSPHPTSILYPTSRPSFTPSWQSFPRSHSSQNISCPHLSTSNFRTILLTIFSHTSFFTDLVRLSSTTKPSNHGDFHLLNDLPLASQLIGVYVISQYVRFSRLTNQTQGWLMVFFCLPDTKWNSPTNLTMGVRWPGGGVGGVQKTSTFEFSWCNQKLGLY